MKKIIIAILAIMLTSSLFAGAKEEKRVASDMRVMLDAVGEMQRAAYYDDARVLRSATAKLISGLDSLLKIKASTYLKKEQRNAEKFAQKRVQMIKMYADDLLTSLDSGNINDVIEDYNQINRQCYSCHFRLRPSK